MNKVLLIGRLVKDSETKIRSLAYVKDECKKLIDQIEKE